MKKSIRVIIGLSGGVDSTVAAALLKKNGFEVIGVFMKFWSLSEDNGLIGPGNKCCSPEAETRARETASILGIPFYVFNFEKEFKKKVVDCFLREYRIGQTPNPCVVCNKEIKFGLLLQKALAFGADYVATGHYARLCREFPISNFQFPKYKLLRGKDKNKDQSYFLWQLNQKQLKHILFPLGNYTKGQVRDLAKKFKLPAATLPESQEICFIPTTINDFLSKYIKSKPGLILSEQKEKIGEHQGLSFYTIGQRKGISVFNSKGPFYVLDKDFKSNFLIVTKKIKNLYRKEFRTKKNNWISNRPPKFPLKVKVKVRYRHKLSNAILSKDKDGKYIRVVFKQAQLAITPGQSAVFYSFARPDELLGGGIIL